MKQYFLLLTILLLTILLKAQSQENRYEGSLSVYHGETRLGDDIGMSFGYIETQVYFNWAMWSLMGEPVYNVNAAVELSTHSLVVVKDGISYSIPEEILFKIRPIDIKVLGVIESKTINVAGGNLGYTVKWDAGAPGKLFTPAAWQSSDTFEKLTKEEQKQYYSFNVAGSPNWDELFMSYKDYISKEQAIEFFKSGLDIDKNGTRVEIKWDLTPIKKYINQQERMALESERAEVDKQKQKLDQKDQAKKEKEEEDFWNTPANTDTEEDVAEREAYYQVKDQLERKYDEIYSEQNDIDREKERYDKLLTDKLDKLKNKPKPGEIQGKYVYTYNKLSVEIPSTKNFKKHNSVFNSGDSQADMRMDFQSTLSDLTLNIFYNVGGFEVEFKNIKGTEYYKFDIMIDAEYKDIYQNSKSGKTGLDYPYNEYSKFSNYGILTFDGNENFSLDPNYSKLYKKGKVTKFSLDNFSSWMKDDKIDAIYTITELSAGKTQFVIKIENNINDDDLLIKLFK